MLGFFILQASPEGGISPLLPLIFLIVVVIIMISVIKKRGAKKELERKESSESKIDRMIKEAKGRRKI